MRAVEVISVLTFFFLLGISIGKTEATIWFPLAIICGWLLADLFSGLVHWALDTYGSVRTPLVGPTLIRPFREHHADPAGMTRHDFFEVNGSSCLGCLPILLATTFLEFNAFADTVLVCFCVGILFTNQCHKWAHMDAPPEFVKALQRYRLVLRPEEHRLHHTPPYKSHFCTANGWLNRPLNFLLR